MKKIVINPIIEKVIHITNTSIKRSASDSNKQVLAKDNKPVTSDSQSDLEDEYLLNIGSDILNASQTTKRIKK